MWKTAWMCAAMLMLGICTADAGASFDCAKAQSADETAICADPVLADIDGIVARAYAAFSPSYQSKAKVGKLLLADRSACGADRACIGAAQYSALETYTYGADPQDQAVPWVESYVIGLVGAKASALAQADNASNKRLPMQLGACAATRIKSITTRFGEPVSDSNEDEGTALSFDNGGYQISYERGDLGAARKGDRVVMCLMSIPRDCPEGDERGRAYYTLDPRIMQQWVLPDAQHLCGGA